MLNYTTEEKNESAGEHSSIENDIGHETFAIVNSVLNAPLILVSIVGNALVLAAIIRTPSLRSVSMIMLSSLAVSDLFVSVFAQPLFIARELTHNGVVFLASKMIGVSLCEVSLLTITAITVDQLMALHFHMRYVTLVTEFRVKCTVVMIWVTIFVLPIFYLWNERVYHLIAALITIICLAISTFSYIRIYRIVRKHQCQIHSQQQAVQRFNAEENLDMRHLKKSAMNAFLFYIFLILCYLPTNILMTLYGISYKDWQREWDFAVTVVFMNSSINPFLYCWRLQELRKVVVKIARQMSCLQTNQD